MKSYHFLLMACFVLPIQQRVLAWQAIQQLDLIGCSASACHGGPLDKKQPWMSSYTKWRKDDPHASAFLTLLSDASREMVRRLPKDSFDEDFYSTIQNKCVSCHSTDTRHVNSWDGVSCASCHQNQSVAASTKWATRHFRNSWNQEVDRTKRLAAQRNLGITDLDDLQTRAKICVDCHVGNERNIVSHDLIAVGHPRLAFEFTTHFSRLEKNAHWNRDEDRLYDRIQRVSWHETSEDGNDSDVQIKRRSFELESWLAGQLVVTEQSLQLIVNYASKNKDIREFAFFDCYSCHHDLSLTKPPTDSAASPGGFRRDRWYALFTKNFMGKSVKEDSNRLDVLVENLSSDSEQTIQTASEIQSVLRRRMQQKISLSTEGLAKALLKFDPSGKPTDEIRQWFVAVLACLRAADMETPLNLTEETVQTITELKQMLNEAAIIQNHQRPSKDSINGHCHLVRKQLERVLP